MKRGVMSDPTRIVIRGLVTCPWCDWRSEIEGPSRDEVITQGKREASEHTATAGHPIKRGRLPRVGYYRGEPIA
jgi:hypothetical protein